MSVDLPMPTTPVDPPGPACGSCALRSVAGLQKMGVDTRGCDVVVALAGNPNTGKSTVFNGLTGMRQHVGNWPGSTVARAEGAYRSHGRVFAVVDLPGAYSLLSTSRDEDVARDFLLFGAPDVTVVVVDPTRLERNLNLVLQILQVTDRVVVALNLMDEARRHGIEVDVRHLARELRVPVVPMVARRGEGFAELVAQISETASLSRSGPASRSRSGPARRPRRLDADVWRAVEALADELIVEFPGLTNAQWVALRLLEGDPGIEQAVREGAIGDLARRRATGDPS